MDDNKNQVKVLQLLCLGPCHRIECLVYAVITLWVEDAYMNISYTREEGCWRWHGNSRRFNQQLELLPSCVCKDTVLFWASFITNFILQRFNRYLLITAPLICWVSLYSVLIMIKKLGLVSVFSLSFLIHRFFFHTCFYPSGPAGFQLVQVFS